MISQQMKMCWDILVEMTEIISLRDYIFLLLRVQDLE